MSEDSTQVLPKLKSFEGILVRIEDSRVLSERYGKQLIELKVWIGGEVLMSSNCSESIQLFSGFIRLESLELIFNDIPNKISFDAYKQCLTQVSNSCRQLSRLSVEVKNDRNYWSIISSFKSLTLLNIRVSEAEIPINTSIECLTSLKRLKHLDISYHNLRDDWFANIGRHLPQLVSIQVITASLITVKTFQYISSLKSLKSLSIVCNDYEIESMKVSDCVIKQVINDCHHLRRLTLHSESGESLDITTEIVNAFIRKAIANPKIRYYLRVFKFKDESSDEYKNRLQPLPHNLVVKDSYY